jgi:hypothetical protein
MILCNVNFSDLTSEELSRIENKCKESYFLSSKETLEKTFLDDMNYLDCYQVTCKQIADRMNYFFLAASIFGSELDSHDFVKLLESEAFVNFQNYRQLNKFIVCFTIHAAVHECPFQSSNDKHYHRNEYGNAEICVINMDTDMHITFSILLPHMIGSHSFFGGIRTNFRVEPSKCIEVLEIISGIDYTLKYNQQELWKLVLYSSNREKEFAGEILNAKLDGEKNGCVFYSETKDKIMTKVFVKVDEESTKEISFGGHIYNFVGRGFYIYERWKTSVLIRRADD